MVSSNAIIEFYVVQFHVLVLLTADTLQWNPSIMDTVGEQHFVCYSEVSLTQGLPIYFL